MTVLRAAVLLGAAAYLFLTIFFSPSRGVARTSRTE